MLARSRLMSLRCDSVQNLAYWLAVWDEIKASAGAGIAETDLAEMFTMTFDIPELHVPIYNYRQARPGASERQYDTLHRAANEVLSSYIRRVRYDSGTRPLPAGGNPLPGGGTGGAPGHGGSLPLPAPPGGAAPQSGSAQPLQMPFWPSASAIPYAPSSREHAPVHLYAVAYARMDAWVHALPAPHCSS